MIDTKSGTEHFYLALVVWREARGEVEDAQLAVALTVMNRVHRPSWWGHSVDEVATKKWQYSSMTDPKDPQLVKWPLLSDSSWAEAWTVAGRVLGGFTMETAAGADSYYDDSISAPNWTANARYCGKIGRLNFYDVDHDYELRT